MRVLLIAGGWSSEREVSLSGAESIAAALRGRGHEVTWFDLRDGFDMLLETAASHDFAFLNLHGAPGEDGLVQALLDRVGCPYQGSGPAGSFLALNKAASKQIFRRAGLRTPDWEFLPVPPVPEWRPRLPYPLFVKSNTGGSSLHLSKAANRTELDAILTEIFATGAEVLLEPAVPGQDVTCGVLGEEALPPVLILPPEGMFFDYKSKYADVSEGGAREICPAPLPTDVIRRIQEMALRAHKALGLRGYSRADFILTEGGDPFLLEANTLPGMTVASLLPKEAAATGLDFSTLLERLMALRLEEKPCADAHRAGAVST